MHTHAAPKAVVKKERRKVHVYVHRGVYEAPPPLLQNTEEKSGGSCTPGPLKYSWKFLRSKTFKDGPSINVLWFNFRGLTCPTY